MPDDPAYTQARAAVGEVLPRLTALVRGLAASPRPAVGHWTVPDVVCHVAHAVDLDTTALAGGRLPGIEPTPAGAAAWNSQMLASDRERDLGVLADRIDVRGTAFLEQAPTEPAVAWIFGARLAPSVVACHLLAELLLHGDDIAKATGAPWVIEPTHAALAITGGGVPIINACPDLWVRPPVDPTARARIELRLRGGHRLTLALDQRLTAEWPPAGAADAYLATTPELALLIFFGRRNPWKVAASGGAIVWAAGHGRCSPSSGRSPRPSRAQPHQRASRRQSRPPPSASQAGYEALSGVSARDVSPPARQRQPQSREMPLRNRRSGSPPAERSVAPELRARATLLVVRSWSAVLRPSRIAWSRAGVATSSQNALWG